MITFLTHLYLFLIFIQFWKLKERIAKGLLGAKCVQCSSNSFFMKQIRSIHQIPTVFANSCLIRTRNFDLFVLLPSTQH